MKKIDYFIATHPHTDHIGGFVDVAKKFKVDCVIMPKIPSKLVPTNPIYEKFLNCLKQKKIKVYEAKAGETYNLEKGKLEILGPLSENYGNLNDFSVITRFVVGNSSFLFGGDAQKAAEFDLLNSGQNLKSSVFKLNHHGSRTSNTKKFLKAVGAKIYVATVGKKNPYNHPHKKVLKYLGKRKLYRTDVNGSIVFKIENDFLKIETEK